MNFKVISTSITILIVILLVWVFADSRQPDHEVRHTVTDLGAGSAKAINNEGQILLVIEDSGEEKSFIREPNGKRTEIISSDWPEVEAEDFNNRGQVIGTAYDYERKEGPGYHAFLWSASGGWTDLDDPTRIDEEGDREFGMVQAINDVGEMVGIGSMGLGANNAPYIWSASDGFRNLREMGITNLNWADDLNDTGYAVLSMESNTKFIESALWNRPEATHTILVDDPEIEMSGWGINNHLQIVGAARRSEFDFWQGGGFWDKVVQIVDEGNLGSHEWHNFAGLWEDGEFYDLNNLIDSDSGWFLELANDINDDGEIVGSGYLNGAESAFLLTPIKEPEGDGG